MSKNLHENHRSRVRERFMKNGLEGFADHEVLELLLYYCYPRRDTNEIAHRLINVYGSLYKLLEADTHDIINRCEVTQNVAVLISMIPKIANLYFRSKWTRDAVRIDDLKIAGKYALSLFVGRTNEAFYALLLDAGYKLNNISLIAEGTLDETPVYPREIVSEALKHQAAAIILMHNHPGGTIKPSHRDMEATRRICEGLKFLSIKVIDHIIVAGDKYYSFAAQDQFVDGY